MTADGPRYGTHIDDIPGQCRALPAPADNWLLLSIANDGKFAFYLDVDSVKRDGDNAEATLALIKPDSGSTELAGQTDISSFDQKVYKTYDCLNHTRNSHKVELYKSLRAAPQLVRTVSNDARPAQVINNPGSADGRALAYVCALKTGQ
jgi:hypothetical protein